MLKFDEMRRPEDATDPPKMILVNELDSKPSRRALH